MIFLKVDFVMLFDANIGCSSSVSPKQGTIGIGIAFDKKRENSVQVDSPIPLDY